MSSINRNQLLADRITELRYSSINFVMFSQLIASKAGLNSTDNECLDYLMLNGPSTAGQLSAFSGLTTGAVTAVIDRLEKAGYVHREHDKADRRRVMVIPNDEKINQDIMPHAAPMALSVAQLSEEFSDADLETVIRFIKRSNEMAGEVITQVKAT
jgi:DNA-binding MarR family transcriptional regulator